MARKRADHIAFSEKRMLSALEMQSYVGLGRKQARAFAESVGAMRKYGRRVLFDRKVLDKALDDMPKGA